MNPDSRKLLAALVAVGLVSAGSGFAADSLAPGEAMGTFSIDGKSVALHHAYAMTQPGDFDETKTDTAILLTEEPLSPDSLAKLKDLESAAQGKGNSLLLKLDESGSAIREVVHHSALGEASLQMSGMTHSGVHVASRSREEISGSLATTEEETFLEHRYKSDVRFRAAGFISDPARQLFDSLKLLLVFAAEGLLRAVRFE